MNFDEMFRPLSEKLQLEPRPQQRHLGWAVVSSIDEGVNLVGEARTGTGKSFAYLVPAIFAARGDKPKRTVVSTETTALQDQLYYKDLPTLHKVYGSFKYSSLKGRSHYYCSTRARLASRGRADIHKAVTTLNAHLAGGLAEGERIHCERRLGFEIPNDVWQQISGDQEWCADNKCTADKCMSARARDKALQSDIVITNHAMLRTDADMRDGQQGGGTLGEFEILVVDEAHTLEHALVDGWTETLAPWEVARAEGSIVEALQMADQVRSSRGEDTRALVERTHMVFDEVEKALDDITKFLYNIAGGDRVSNWRRENFPLAEFTLSGSQSAKTVQAMVDYETRVPQRLQTALDHFEKAEEAIKKGVDYVDDAAALGQRISGVRKLRTGLRAVRSLRSVFDTALESMKTRDGIVMRFGVPYGVIADGYVNRKGERSVSIRTVPLDISKRVAETVWPDKVCILVSATLVDPTSGTFDYTATSLGVTGYRTVQVDTPFALATQQLVYVTPATQDVVQTVGARYSVDELIDVVNASNGRTLILFTARAELDDAYDLLMAAQRSGRFPHKIYYQDVDTPKQKLVDAFRHDEGSVLLATKSFFTGVDFPGATCTTVAICKFPLPQYNSLCKQQIAWWRRRGFPNWYERESLLVFSQAAGRLIRSETDHGVVALLDQRCHDPRERVYATAQIGIKATGSRVSHSVDEVRAFLSERQATGASA